MTLLNRDAILAAQDLKFEDVDVPEWGGPVRVRVMTGAERDSYSNDLLDASGKFDAKAYRAKLLARCLVDDTGARLFTDDQVIELQNKSAAVIDRLFSVADRINGVNNAAVDEAAKN